MKSALLLCSLVCSTATVDSQTPSGAACKDADTCKDDEVSLLQTVSDVRKHSALTQQNLAAKDLKATLKEISDKEAKWENNIKLTITLKKGVGMKDADSYGWGASDPFCEVKLAVCAGCHGTKDKTMKMSPVVINSNNPVWNWKYETYDWSTGDRVVFTCYDHDTVGKNDLLGTAMLELEKRGEKFKDRPIQLTRKGVLYLDIDWEDCKSDCEDMVSTTAKIAEYTYKFDLKASSYNLALQDYFASSNPQFGEDHLALYKKKGTTDCMLAFSGSNDKGDWAQNFDKKAAKNVCGVKKIHQGFLSEVTDYFKSESMVLFSKVINKICGGKVTAVGHSVGGAVATIAAGCLNSKGGVKAIPKAHKDIEPFTVHALYTIGAPAVSSPQITNRDGTCFAGKRTFNFDFDSYDVVPYIGSVSGYVHPKVQALEMGGDDNGKMKFQEYRCFTPQAKLYPYNHTKGFKNRVPSSEDHKGSTYIHRAKELFSR